MGITVISPSFAKVGAEAVRRFEKFTGLKAKVLRCRDAEGYSTKLSLDRLSPRGPVIYFDADLWLVRPVDFVPLCGSPAVGVAHDPMVFHSHETAFPARDCEAFSIPKLDYFNSGLMVLDFARVDHRALFQRARRERDLPKSRQVAVPLDKTDQFWLNLARHQLGIPWQRLPWGFNFYLRAVEWGAAFMTHPVTAVHAAGVPVKHKLKHLRAAAEVFGGEAHPVQDELLRFEHAYRTQLR